MTCRCRTRPLNEGRDSRPGNGTWLRPDHPAGAQRSTRAGTRVPATGAPAGRQGAGHRRSTRAGTRVPATAAPSADPDDESGISAQRGPGLASRQRMLVLICRPQMRMVTLNEGRDSRPGNGRRAVGYMVDSFQRSTRAGTRVPATVEPTGAYVVAADALNEGRDSRPGNGSSWSVGPSSCSSLAQRGPGLASRQRGYDTSIVVLIVDVAQRGPGLASRQRLLHPPRRHRHHRRRSTRAGTRVPATVGHVGPPPFGFGLRSTRAGTRVPATVGLPVGGSGNRRWRAQRGPGLASRQRSPSSRSSPTRTATLNEGRQRVQGVQLVPPLLISTRTATLNEGRQRALRHVVWPSEL